MGHRVTSGAGCVAAQRAVRCLLGERDGDRVVLEPLNIGVDLLRVLCISVVVLAVRDSALSMHRAEADAHLVAIELAGLDDPVGTSLGCVRVDRSGVELEVDASKRRRPGPQPRCMDRRLERFCRRSRSRRHGGGSSRCSLQWSCGGSSSNGPRKARGRQHSSSRHLRLAGRSLWLCLVSTQSHQPSSSGFLHRTEPPPSALRTEPQ